MAITDTLRVIDADTHVLEPYDLWTSRMSATKWGDRIPHVVWSDEMQTEIWLSHDRMMGFGSAWAAHAGSDHWYPYLNKRWADAMESTPGAIDPALRLQVMDDYGIYAELLYPNVLLFGGDLIADPFTRRAQIEDSAFYTECTRAYNDFLTDYTSTDPSRFVPIAMLPFWDVEASIAEMQRAVGNGHKGVVFPQFPEFHGQPMLSDRHWDRLWAAVQEAGIAVNFHVGSGGASQPLQIVADDFLPENAGKSGKGGGANATATTGTSFIENSRTIAALTCGGICDRFPRLKFVSVESGAGWIPFVLQSLDWIWKNSAARIEHPSYLLPSEFFRRQMYACFFFEEGGPLDATIEFLGADTLLYETDFPHPASMAPGPTTSAVKPKEYIETKLGHLPEATLRKLLHDNAASLYHLE